MPFQLGIPEIILILVILLLLVGPSKLPDLARSLGEAVKEYKRASAGILAPSTPKREEELLLQTARKLGIETKGKSIEKIAEEILQRAEKTKEEATK
jgi:sec-independent protein translocase protein TatA